MAAGSRQNRKAAAEMELPECPICLETMSAPIFQCQSGHSLCHSCSNTLRQRGDTCPICRQPMTNMRNLSLEEIISKARVECPNKRAGCVYNVTGAGLADHLADCFFRDVACPLGVVFGKCSWTGKIKDMMEHCKERHEANCNIGSDADVELTDCAVTEDDRHVFLATEFKMLFVITFKIDTIQKMAYWAVQHIGSKKVANQYLYEIHVISKQHSHRQAVFTEHCFSDTIKLDDMLRQGKCPMMPLEMLAHFIKDKKMVFKYNIKRMSQGHPNKKVDNSDNRNENSPNYSAPKNRSANKGPKPKGPWPKKTQVNE